MFSDSLCGTSGVGERFNNPSNLRPLHRKDAPHIGYVDYARYGAYEHFYTIEDGVYAAVDLYLRNYAGMMPDEITRVWANSNSHGYMSTIESCFSQV